MKFYFFFHTETSQGRQRCQQERMSRCWISRFLVILKVFIREHIIQPTASIEKWISKAVLLNFFSLTSSSALSHHSPQYWGTVPGRLCTGRRYVLPTVCATFQFYLVKAPYSTFLSKSFVSAVVFQRNLTHIQCTRTGSDLCSIRSLINPVFPCERSLEGSAGGQRVASILPL